MDCNYQWKNRQSPRLPNGKKTHPFHECVRAWHFPGTAHKCACGASKDKKQ